MVEFVQGQRWVADTEPELGLGTVVAVEGRSVSIFFEQGNCERCYSMLQAPLTRIRFSVDDEIQLNDATSGVVQEIEEHEGLVFYCTTDGRVLPETSLSSEIKLNQPFMRLMTGQLDHPKWFHFRRQLDRAISRLWQSQLNGLLGARASLVPHQLYVAWTACHREKVRVLLADEVGLGKTIEAGLILARLIKQDRVSRALILVPDVLQVQWLVELVRRFYLKPELYAGEEHDFAIGQIHIVPHSAITNASELFLKESFDITIVDEAHNIQEEQETFAQLAAIAETSPHLILLTATPEQLGVKSHFERLKLLDPIKFSNYDQFLSEEKKFSELNQQIQALPQGRETLIQAFNLTCETDEELIDQLLDSHGVGRNMFRNVRKAVAGFPSRIVHTHQIDEDQWQAKYEWLAQWLMSFSPEKVLVITHNIDQVFECEKYLWEKHGLDAAIFHEEQTLIERDKAAAYFADMEQGSKILICSEIGSEGRNFQFCHQLVCLDLPDHPDLLEQRIGRLDRIGQKKDVHIHVPSAQNSDTEKRSHWYHSILNCMEMQNPAAGAIHNQYWSDYKASPSEDLIKEIQNALNQLKDEIENGRDALLELNSCRQPDANNLAKKIQAFESDNPLALVELASELLQFHFEESRLGAFNLVPSDKMLVPTLPGIPPEGAEVTFSRESANSREDFLFLTWDSPFILGLWELLNHSELGSASVATLPSRQLPAGHCLLESCFDVIVQSEHFAACKQFFPTLSIRSLALDISDKDLSATLEEEALQSSILDVKKYLAKEVIQSKKTDIPTWYEKSEKFADTQLSNLIQVTASNAAAYFEKEIARMRQLHAMNNVVSPEEIEDLVNTAKEIHDAIMEKTHLHLSATRLIVVTEPN